MWKPVLYLEAKADNNLSTLSLKVKSSLLTGGDIGSQPFTLEAKADDILSILCPEGGIQPFNRRREWKPAFYLVLRREG
jgi:hypothetical protein